MRVHRLDTTFVPLLGLLCADIAPSLAVSDAIAAHRSGVPASMAEAGVGWAKDEEPDSARGIGVYSYNDDPILAEPADGTPGQGANTARAVPASRHPGTDRPEGDAAEGGDA